MFYASYIVSELRRRWGRTVLTALGLAVGVGLVVTVNALSTGLDRAQADILRPLTGVGTDLSVSRPISVPGESDEGGLAPQLSRKEIRQLEEENAAARVALENLGKPGTRFSRVVFASTAKLSFPQGEVADIRSLDGVGAAAGGLTVSAVHVEGKVPKITATEQNQVIQQGLREIEVTSISITGVDDRVRALGAITPAQITRGRYFASGSAREAVLNVAYARRRNLELGETVKLGKRPFEVVGYVETPLGGQASDIYVKLGQLQSLSDRHGRVNTVYVRARSADDVAGIARAVPKRLDGAAVTTAEELAERVTGSLVDAKNLTEKLGTVLIVVGLAAAFLIAIVLTLSSVAKRTRELGTLKALGWPQRHVVRQVTGEALLQGLVGGALGVAVGVGGALLLEAIVPALHATVAEAKQSTDPIGFFTFGQGAVASGSREVPLEAPVDGVLVGVAVVLALAGGLLAGAVGGFRAARLRPAVALRHLD